jgi:propionyl-CoA carboxylase alpha chain
MHPGYGFLSENAAFAQACAEAGLKFIGPSPEVIRSMGEKTAARSIMEKAGVPVVPGALLPDPDADGAFPEQEVLDAAREVGFPLMVKAAFGGGGKGMRLVEEQSGLAKACQGAWREARGAFGNGTVYLERFIERPRHVEFQIFGDQHGNHVHLFERECSIQRRHQKIIEETPSPALDEALRDEMGAAAVAAAAAVNYEGAGTVEFLLGQDRRFYFLEMNTRLQVEHPVTELITGCDLVRAMVEIAQGNGIIYEQDEMRQHGWALEFPALCRGCQPRLRSQHRPYRGHDRAPWGPGCGWTRAFTRVLTCPSITTPCWPSSSSGPRTGNWSSPAHNGC